MNSCLQNIEIFLVVERAPNTKIHIPVKENNGSPNKNSKCCTKVEFKIYENSTEAL